VILFKLADDYSSIFPILHQDWFNRDFRADELEYLKPNKLPGKRLQDEAPSDPVGLAAEAYQPFLGMFPSGERFFPTVFRSLGHLGKRSRQADQKFEVTSLGSKVLSTFMREIYSGTRCPAARIAEGPRAAMQFTSRLSPSERSSWQDLPPLVIVTTERSGASAMGLEKQI
jgi:hypothetical protein